MRQNATIFSPYLSVKHHFSYYNLKTVKVRQTHNMSDTSEKIDNSKLSPNIILCRACKKSIVDGKTSQCPGCYVLYHAGCASRSNQMANGNFSRCCGSRSASPSSLSGTKDLHKIIGDAISNLHSTLSKENTKAWTMLKVR